MDCRVRRHRSAAGHGSYVSGLMSWRALDVMVLAGPDYTPYDV